MTKNSLKQKQMTANHNKAKNIKDWLRTQHITHRSVFITTLHCFTVYWHSYPLYSVREIHTFHCTFILKEYHR